jgi:hypothetical protein
MLNLLEKHKDVIKAFPYHKHLEGKVLASKETTLEEILIISSLPLFCRSKLSFDFA